MASATSAEWNWGVTYATILINTQMTPFHCVLTALAFAPRTKKVISRQNHDGIRCAACV